MTRRKVWRAVGAGLITAAAMALVTVPADADDPSVQLDLAEARVATGIFHHEPFAVAAGYERTDACAESPAGAMGYHYVNPEHIGGPLDPGRPQAVLYLPGPNGKRKLVAVEYIVVDADQNLDTVEHHELFGQTFQGPMEGHEPGMPRHYDLHVWLWKHNPDGLFAQWNPVGHC